MNLNRIDADLKLSLDNSPSFELDLDIFRNTPEILQAYGEEFKKNNPYVRPDGINVRDLFIQSSEDGQEIRLHIYQPSDFHKNNVILYFHGGGYVFGTPEHGDGQMYRIARETKATIISVDYRLAPKYKFPIPIQDGYDALIWTITKGTNELNIDPAAITVYGASAGGHLAAAITQMAIDNGIENIKHQILLYPVIHNKLTTASMEEFVDAPLWNKRYAEIAWLHFLGKQNADKRIKYADLTFYDQFQKLPKTTIIASELDPLRDEGIEYAQLLYKAGIRTELWVVPGALHIFDFFPSVLTEKFYNFLIDRLK
ncbi:alpha/beta hydrolase [Chitinophaga silvatica]|uniref:Alpha/beta hydrolase n=1 Tax=Chitinophaga silvatica TaxID=2282649 RepID=A0A3E1YDS1_9BACT|nr:alpha/beta hydrolase [Chitinophaga silvatica]RFS24750.1 alpha/beta hydrolase [Chitinophaga silvatica]